jgi:hypothetical protein
MFQAWYWSWVSYEYQEKDASKEAVDADVKNAEALEVQHLEQFPLEMTCPDWYLDLPAHKRRPCTSYNWQVIQ